MSLFSIDRVKRGFSDNSTNFSIVAVNFSTASLTSLCLDSLVFTDFAAVRTVSNSAHV
ncbi:Uncharacterised protein [Streptococcus pneumoniae]|nr:Uncharacterised protein [Streptococcus pneumoniae]